MIQYLYLGRVDYGEGLLLQAEVAGLLAEGRAKMCCCCLSIRRC